MKLILVRSIDYLIKKQAESVKVKNDRMIQDIFHNELIGPLNTVVNQARVLVDDKQMFKSSSGSQIGNKILHSIWSGSKMMQFLVQSVRSRKRFQENDKILNLQEIKPSEVPMLLQELLDAFSPLLSSKSLKVSVENLMGLPDGGRDPERISHGKVSSESRSSIGVKQGNILVADWYLYQLTLFHLIYSA